MRWLLTVAMLIVGGILAASSLIVARKPNAQELIDKLTPYQGWIGIALFIGGIVDTIFLIRYIGGMFQASVLLSLFYIVAVPTELLIGFMLGFGLITKYALSKNETAMAKGQSIRAKLAPIQGILGLISIAVGVIYFVLCLIYF
jgi:hypothetical protein